MEPIKGTTIADQSKLIARGYSVIPICGKAPLWEGWREGVGKDRAKLEAIRAARPNHENTGLLTGHLVMADVDLWNPEHAETVSETVQAVLGLSVLERIGSKGCGLFYFNRKPITKITVVGRPPGAKPKDKPEKVEFLGVGQQVAAFGEHPDTGEPYKWNGGSLLDHDLDKLPEVTPALIREAAHKVKAHLGELGYTDLKMTGDGSRDGGQPTGEPVTAAMLEDMLSHIDPACDRLTWIGIGGAIKAARVIDRATGDEDPDFDGAELYDRWSSGDLNPDHAPGNYAGRSDCDSNFAGLKASRTGGSGVGTIVHLACPPHGGYTGETRVPAIELLRGVKTNGANEAAPPMAAESEEIAAGEIPEAANDDSWFAPVAALNDRFAIMTGGKHAGRIVDLSNPVAPHFLDGARFHSMYRHRKVTPPATEADSNPKPTPTSKLWEGWSDRHEITDVVFVPPGTPHAPPAGAHNLWTGYAVEPKEGEAHARFLAHVRDIICGGDDDLYEWLTAWMADAVQRPGDKPGAAIALRGIQGAGKTIFYRFFKAIFGAHAATASDPRHVVGNFNAHLAGKIVLGVEEGFWAGSKEAESRLKDLITAPDMLLEQKGVDPVEVENHLHIVVTSNERWLVPVAADDRRWTIFDVLPDRAKRTPENRAYWTRLYADLQGDGPANFLHYLLARNYDRGRLFDPCGTLAKVDQAMESMGSLEQWWLDVLRDDRDPVAGRVTSQEDEQRPDGIFGTDTPKTRIVADYKEWCADNRHLRSLSSIAFWKAFPPLVGKGLTFHRLGDEKRTRCVWLPPRDLCRAAFAKQYRTEWKALDGEDD